MKKIETWINRIVLVMLALLSMIVIYTSFSSIIMRSKKAAKFMRLWYWRWGILLLGCIVIGIVIVVLYRGIQRIKEENIRRVGKIVFLCIIGLQIGYLFFMANPSPKADNGAVYNTAVDMVEEGTGILDNTSGYFARYTNNHFIVLIFYYYFKWLKAVHITSYWSAATILNMIMIDLGIVFAYLAVKRMQQERNAVFLLCLFALCPTTYQWSTFVYTSTISTAFTMGILFLTVFYAQTEEKRTRYKIMALVGVVAAIGYRIRPTTIIPVIAISYVVTLYLEKKKRNVYYRRGLC